MKLLSIIFFSLFLFSNLFSQTFNIELEAVDSNLTWPWNWDIVSDGDRLITVNEIGTLNIRENGVWQNIPIDPNNSDLEPRSVSVDSSGNIWIATLDHGLWQYSTDNQFINYNTTNSSLPTDKLRILKKFGNDLWISTSDKEGLIRFNIVSQESDLFNMDNSDQLKTDANLDPYIDLTGKVWLDNRECLSIIATDLSWTSEDFRSVVSGAMINDIDFVTPEITYITADGGIVKVEDDTYELVLDDRLNDYNAFHQDKAGNQWIHYTRITSEFLMVIRDGDLYEVSRDSIDIIPSQVFKMIEHQDTIMMVGLLGNNIAKCTFDFPSSVADKEIAQIKIYPNPANEYLHIQGIQNQEYKYTIYNLDGQRIQTGSINNNRAPVSGLPEGNYLIELSSKDSTNKYTEKFSVIR